MVRQASHSARHWGVPMTATTAGAVPQKALGRVNAADHRLQK